jgi:hypothetical protein
VPAPSAPLLEPAPRKEVVLYDDEKPNDAVHQDVSDAEANRVLTHIFPRFLKRYEDCSSDGWTEPGLEGARSSGHFVPWVTAKAEGSFTRAGAHETVYDVMVRECGASHAESWGTRLFVVFDAGLVVARVSESGDARITRVVDVDADGRDEVVIVGGFSNQGWTTSSALLARIEPTKLTEVEDFGEVYESDCAGMPGLGTKTVRSSTIRATVPVRSAADYHVERRTDPCD